MHDPISSSDPTATEDIGVFRKLGQARDAALVLAAKAIPYSIDRLGKHWVIRVESPLAGLARAELNAMEEEQKQLPEDVPTLAFEKLRPLPLFVALWLLSAFFFAQQILGAEWVQLGVAVSRRIVGAGEWWRAMTALTLHGDLPHLVANLGTGLLFAAFLQPLLGSGWTWLLILTSGVGGNLLNAWFFRDLAHASLGASTGVFGALGLLVGLEVWARWSHPRHRNRWMLVLPLGAGLALFAYLGVGDETKRIDITAHLFGMIVGLPLGFFAGLWRFRERTTRAAQVLLALGTLTLPLVAWWIAIVHR